MVLPSTARAIPGSIEHWIDIDGSVYAINHRNNQPPRLYRKAQNSVYGYMSCGIQYVGKKGLVSRRVHRLVAEAFIPNPDHLPLVGHKNNIKSDNRVDNLYWTTPRDNTQKAFDDGLAKNDSGIEDSQSNPCAMFDTKTNRLLHVYGSISEAHRETGIEKTTISRQCRYHRPVRKPFYFRFCSKEFYFSHKCESTIESC